MPATGCRSSGRNYLVPVDASLQGERDLDFEAVSVDFVLKQMELEREGKTNVVFLDACRDNPLARNLARSMGTRSASIGQGPGAGADGGRHLHRLLDAAGQRRARRRGAQLAVHRRARQGVSGARPQSDLGHDRCAQGRAGGRPAASRCRGTTRR